MSFIVIARGRESEKIIEGTREFVIPFVGADHGGQSSKVGIGVIIPRRESALFFGVLSPHHLMKSWRGMKILEHVGYIDGTTFSSCFSLGDRMECTHDVMYVSELATHVGGEEVLSIYRKSALAALPSMSDIFHMTHTCVMCGIPFSAQEIVREFKKAGVSAPESIRRMARAEEPQGNIARWISHLFRSS